MFVCYIIYKHSDPVTSIEAQFGAFSPSDPDAVSLSVDRNISHPSFNPADGTLLNDIALLRLASPVQFTDIVRPICLPDIDFYSYDVCYATGWGQTSAAHSNKIILLLLVDISTSFFEVIGPNRHKFSLPLDEA